MRKTFIAILLVLVLAPAAHAQLLGLKVGPTWSKFEPEVTTIEEPLFYYGVGFMYQFGKGNVRLQLEGLYLQKGIAFPENEDSISGKFKLNYIEVPALVVVQSKNSGPFAYAGPALSIEGNCFAHVKGPRITVESACNDQNVVMPRRHRLDYSVMAGAGFRYVLGKRILTLEARQSLGLRNINADETMPDAKNKQFSIFLGFQTRPIPKK